MSSPGRWRRHVAVCVAGVLIAWLGLASTAEATPLRDPPAVAYNYNAPGLSAVVDNAITERGPPCSGYDQVLLSAAVDSSSRGASARPRSSPTRADKYNDYASQLARIDTGSGTTEDAPGEHDARLCAFAAGDVAARSADGVPSGQIALV